VFLDEPTTGFDPAARRQSWELIGGLRALGKTILLTTHYMEEAHRLADRVVVIAGGRVIAEGAPDALGRETAEETLVAFRLPGDVDVHDLPLPDRTKRLGRSLAFHTPTPTLDLAPVLSWAAVRGIELEGLTVTRPPSRTSTSS